jgi:ubiquinol-cytochrome c reductase iron-sulfur subunit
MGGPSSVSRPPRTALVAAAVGLLAFGLAGVVLVIATDDRWVAAAAGIGIAALGIAFVMWAKEADEPGEEERVQKGPDQARRRLILLAGAGAAVTTTAAISVPVFLRTDAAARRLRSTAWSEGTRVVDAFGNLVRADGIEIGDLINIYPEGWVGESDSQGIMLRDDPARFSPDARPSPDPIEGVIAYSKLCTHMACPLGLYQQQSGTLLCPCHQALFDVLDGGRVLRGPASRPLPQLPLGVDGDGTLIALGDFTDAVGTGFWSR